MHHSSRTAKQSTIINNAELLRQQRISQTTVLPRDRGGTWRNTMSTATFILPVKNAQDYFDRNDTMNEHQLREYLIRYADAVCEYVVSSGIANECDYRFDNNTLGGTTWEHSDDVEREELDRAKSYIWDSGTF